MNDSSDNISNNIFNLNFEKVLKEDDRNEEFLLDDNDKLISDNNCQLFGGFFDNHNDYYISRHNSVNSLPFDV